MSVFLVSYDLRDPGRDYQPVYDALTRAGARPVLLSDWLLRTDWSAAQIRDWLMQLVDSNDRVFVNLLDGVGWIQSHHRPERILTRT